MKKGFCIRLAAAAVSAALLWAAFEPLGETADLVFALAPLLLLARLATPAQAARWWFGAGFAFWFATLAWFPAVVKNDGPWPLVVLGWAGLSALCAGYFALFGALDALLWRRWGASRLRLAVLLVGEPALWAGCEWLRATLFTGFAWNFLGTALAKVPSLAAPASAGGVYFVSALVVLVNGVFATLGARALAPLTGGAATAPRGGRFARSLETALPLAAVLLALACAPRPASRAIPLRVALVQRNAPCLFRAAQREDPCLVFGKLLETAAPARPDLVVFAESALTEFGRGGVRGNPARAAAAKFLAQTGAAGLLAGGDDFEAAADATRTYNAAALYTPATNDTLRVQVYHKQHLVPFGEYIFLDKWIPALQKLSPIGVSCWPGETAVLELPRAAGPVRLAPLICYEDTDPALARKAAAAGAQALVLITNDSWFSRSHEARQHAAQAVLRAIETGLPVIRTGNSGVTGVIAASGRARWLSDDEAGTPMVDAPGCQLETVAVPEAPRPTPYVRFGDAPLLVLFALACLAALCPRRAAV